MENTSCSFYTLWSFFLRFLLCYKKKKGRYYFKRNENKRKNAEESLPKLNTSCSKKKKALLSTISFAVCFTSTYLFLRIRLSIYV